MDWPRGHRVSWEPDHFDPMPPVAAEPPPERQHWLRRLLAPVAGAGLVLWKVAGPLLLAIKNVKFLATSASFLVSLVAYTSIWGWRFALGFMVPPRSTQVTLRPWAENAPRSGFAPPVIWSFQRSMFASAEPPCPGPK